MVLSGILIDTRIHLQQRRTKTSYLVFRYSHRYSNNTFDKEERRQVMLSSGVLNVIRIYLRQRGTKTNYVVFRYSHPYSNTPSTKRNEDKLCCLQIFSSLFEYTLDKEEQRPVRLSSGILIDIRLRLNQESSGHAMLSSAMLSSVYSIVKPITNIFRIASNYNILTKDIEAKYFLPKNEMGLQS